MLLIDGVKYRLWTPKDEEKEFHPMIKEHSNEIFGESSLYFDVRHKLISRLGICSIPDAYVISLSKPYKWYIVENELASHRVYEHIVPQVSRFISGIENLRSQREIRDVIYNEITQDKVLKAFVEKMIYPEEIHRFLSSLVSKPPKIAIIIDEVTDEVKEASKALKKLGETEIVEFKTYVREDAENVRAHLFEPVYVPTAKVTVKETEEPRKAKLPPHYKNWQTMLAWVDENTRDVVKALTNRILELRNVKHKPIGRYYGFYRNEIMSKSRFVAFILTRKKVSVRVRVDPATFRDPNNWVSSKVYKGFFFHHGRGQERQFSVDSVDQVSYAMELIKQSYELAK